MKIGIDARMYRSSVAGIGRYSQNLIKNLLELDRENQYLLFVTPEDEKDAQEKLPKTGNYQIVTVEVPHYSLSEQTKLPQIISRKNPDVMFFTNTNFPIRYKGKFIVVIHDLTLYFFPETARKNNFVRRKAFNLVLKNAVKKSAKIITDSENTRKDILKVFHADPAKIVVIKLAADDKKLIETSSDKIESLKRKFQINSPVILYVGQFRAHKNIPELVHAFEIIRSQIPVKLVLVGKTDPNYRELAEAIDKSPYKSDIVMPGFVSDEDLSAWYRLSTCYVFPSLYEGFGLPALESMMAKTAVVSSDRSSLPEVCGDAALYFDPENRDDMAEKIKQVLLDKNLRKELISKGEAQVRKFSWASTAEETLKIIKEVGAK